MQAEASKKGANQSLGIEIRRFHPVWFVLPALILLFVIIVYPLGYSFYLSLHDFNLAKPYARCFIGLGNYIEIFKDSHFLESLGLTFILSGFILVVEFCVGMGIALLINRRMKGMLIIQTLFFIPFAMTPIATALLWRYIFEPDIGVLNYLLRVMGFEALKWHAGGSTALVSIGIVSVWRWIPFTIVILLAGLESLPLSVYEAARLAGASSSQILRYITIPMLKPLMIFLILIRSLYSLKLFEPVHILTQGGPGSVTEIFNYRLYKTVFRFFDVGYGATMSFVMFGLCILLCLVLVNFVPER